MLSDAEVWLSDTQVNRIEVSGKAAEIGSPMAEGIGAAVAGQGELLRSQIHEAISQMLSEVCGTAGVDTTAVNVMVVAGNTTMLYLLTGRNPERLSHAPFQVDTLFDTEEQLLGIRVYYPPRMNAFVGADITCAVLASGMHQSPQTALLCDPCGRMDGFM